MQRRSIVRRSSSTASRDWATRSNFVATSLWSLRVVLALSLRSRSHCGNSCPALLVCRNASPRARRCRISTCIAHYSAYHWRSEHGSKRFRRRHPICARRRMGRTGARLGPKDRPRIGLVWSGNPQHRDDRKRSIQLNELSPLLDVAATFVSLQKDLRAGDEVVLTERSNIINLGQSLESFADTAALISHLDLVVSVDTSVAHLAGALGRPVWVLVPFVPDWRWLLDRDDSPWYPTARLIRQTETRDWRGVVDGVRAALHDLVENKRADRVLSLTASNPR